MSFKTLVTEECVMFVAPGDMVRVTYTRAPQIGELSPAHERTSTVAEIEIKEEFRITTVKIVEFENEFGLKRGLAAVLGE